LLLLLSPLGILAEEKSVVQLIGDDLSIEPAQGGHVAIKGVVVADEIASCTARAGSYTNELGDLEGQLRDIQVLLIDCFVFCIL
jgi:hypothetical protein